MSTSTAWDGRTVNYDHYDERLVLAGDTTYGYHDGQLTAVDDGFVPRSFTYTDGALVGATDRDGASWTFASADDELSLTQSSSSGRNYILDADNGSRGSSMIAMVQ